jgi:hypothetical protein
VPAIYLACRRAAAVFALFPPVVVVVVVVAPRSIPRINAVQASEIFVTRPWTKLVLERARLQPLNDPHVTVAPFLHITNYQNEQNKPCPHRAGRDAQKELKVICLPSCGKALGCILAVDLPCDHVHPVIWTAEREYHIQP